MGCEDSEEWSKAIEEEMNLVDKPERLKLVGCKWIYKRNEWRRLGTSLD